MSNMTLDELKKLVEKDLPINDNHLDTESLRSQELYAKYSDIKTKFEFLKSEKISCVYSAKLVTARK